MTALFMFLAKTNIEQESKLHHNGVYIRYPENLPEHRIILNKQILEEDPINILLHEWTHAIICSSFKPSDRHNKRFYTLYEIIKEEIDNYILL